MLERVQKIMAQAGIASRRKCEELIEKGLVKVNNKPIKLGDKADSEKDKIAVNGKLIKKQDKIYIIINKPRGILSSAKDDRGRKTVVDLVKTTERIFPVGRLDFNSEGLMILTNDGDFSNEIIHPRYNVNKEYEVVLDRLLTRDHTKRLKSGIKVGGKKVNVIGLKQEENMITLGIHEGRKHIIRKIFEILGYKVINLKRVAIGNLALDLDKGKHKVVSKAWLKDNLF